MIHLEDNKINKGGYPYICKSQWPKLKQISICISLIMLEENAISTGVIVLKKAYPTVKIYHDEFDENAD